MTTDNQRPTVAILDHHVADLHERWEAPLITRNFNVKIIQPKLSLNAVDILDQVDGLLLPGGDSNISPGFTGRDEHHKDTRFDAERDWSAIKLAEEALKQQIPTLGICRGFQELIVAHGGKIDLLPNHDLHGSGYAHKGCLKSMDKKIHPIRFDRNGQLSNVFAGILDQDHSIMVNSIHHEGITLSTWFSDECTKLRNHYKIEALAPDDTIEAISAIRAPFNIGVQAHFELKGPLQEALFNEFAKHINAYSQTKSITQDLNHSPS